MERFSIKRLEFNLFKNSLIHRLRAASVAMKAVNRDRNGRRD
jgi:hypothetical protein